MRPPKTLPVFDHSAVESTGASQNEAEREEKPEVHTIPGQEQSGATLKENQRDLLLTPIR